MPEFVALLRGVNIGKAGLVPTAELRTLMSRLGYTDVVTLLDSGNAVFGAATGTPSSHAAKIAAAILSRLKIEVPVIVKSAGELAAIVTENKIQPEAADHSRFLVAFVQNPKPLADLATIQSLVKPPERFVVGRHAAYLFCANGILESKAGEALLGKAGRSATSRNWATVLKLNALATDRAMRR